MFFFFFQAEDGIRDYKVTGVQTCALPILKLLLECPHRFLLQEILYLREPNSLPGKRELEPSAYGRIFHATAEAFFREHGDRKSGRVGKECRSRWSPYH